MALPSPPGLRLVSIKEPYAVSLTTRTAASQKDYFGRARYPAAACARLTLKSCSVMTSSRLIPSLYLPRALSHGIRDWGRRSSKHVSAPTLTLDVDGCVGCVRGLACALWRSSNGTGGLHDHLTGSLRACMMRLIRAPCICAHMRWHERAPSMTCACAWRGDAQ